jgi:hypothetical protein
MLMRLYVGPKGGSHVHIRIFAGKARGYTLAKLGDLMLSPDESEAFLAVISRGARVVPHIDGLDVEIIHEYESGHSVAPPVPRID